MSNEIPNWPVSSIIYQIYPRSFKDSNDDGIGDLKGIIEKADYLAKLGINAIWISPIYPSPQVDFGYDISDFCNIDPIYGTLNDFDSLIEIYHQRGIKVLMDYVPNHSSSKHAWFEESRSSKDNSKRDWYIWADPKADGSPPNNWISNFGGPAWTLDPITGQYYYHAFDKEQPDLNWRNPQVVEEMLNVLRFWMERGVDGFRVDAVYFLFEDSKLRDDPINQTFEPEKHSEHNSLIHTYTFSLPETLEMMKKMTEVLQEYEHKFMVTEVYSGLPELVKMYTKIGWQWYTPFNFSFISLPWQAEIHKQYIDEYDASLGNRYIPSYVLGNHDTHRIASRIGIKQARIAAMAQLTLRGIPYIYSGEEIGMTDTHIPKDMIIDTYEIHSPGLGLGRDPERTPMQWSDEKYAGFSNAEKTWLPVNENYHKINVRAEEKDPHSFLHLYTLLIKLKKHNPAIRDGRYIPLQSNAKNIFMYKRQSDSHTILVLLNFDEHEKKISLAITEAIIVCNASLTAQEGEKIDLTNFNLPGNEGYIFSLPA